MLILLHRAVSGQDKPAAFLINTDDLSLAEPAGPGHPEEGSVLSLRSGPILTPCVERPEEILAVVLDGEGEKDVPCAAAPCCSCEHEGMEAEDEPCKTCLQRFWGDWTHVETAEEEPC